MSFSVRNTSDRYVSVRAVSKKTKNEKKNDACMFTIGFNKNLLVELLRTIIKKMPLSH